MASPPSPQASLRDLSGRSDRAAVMGRLQRELDHLRCDRGLAGLQYAVVRGLCLACAQALSCITFCCSLQQLDLLERALEHCH